MLPAALVNGGLRPGHGQLKPCRSSDFVYDGSLQSLTVARLNSPDIRVTRRSWCKTRASVSTFLFLIHFVSPSCLLCIPRGAQLDLRHTSSRPARSTSFLLTRNLQRLNKKHEHSLPIKLPFATKFQILTIVQSHLHAHLHLSPCLWLKIGVLWNICKLGSVSSDLQGRGFASAQHLLGLSNFLFSCEVHRG